MNVRLEDLPKKGTQLRNIYDVLLSHEYMSRDAIAAKVGVNKDKLWASSFTDLRRQGLIECKLGAAKNGKGRRPQLFRRTKQLTPEVVTKKVRGRNINSVRQDIAVCFVQLQKLTDELEERIKDELLAKMKSL